VTGVRLFVASKITAKVAILRMEILVLYDFTVLGERANCKIIVYI
jgi:hypothetical protein